MISSIEEINLQHYILSFLGSNDFYNLALTSKYYAKLVANNVKFCALRKTALAEYTVKGMSYQHQRFWKGEKKILMPQKDAPMYDPNIHSSLLNPFNYVRNLYTILFQFDWFLFFLYEDYPITHKLNHPWGTMTLHHAWVVVSVYAIFTTWEAWAYLLPEYRFELPPGTEACSTTCMFYATNLFFSATRQFCANLSFLFLFFPATIPAIYVFEFTSPLQKFLSKIRIFSYLVFLIAFPFLWLFYHQIELIIYHSSSSLMLLGVFVWAALFFGTKWNIRIKVILAPSIILFFIFLLNFYLVFPIIAILLYFTIFVIQIDETLFYDRKFDKKESWRSHLFIGYRPVFSVYILTSIVFGYFLFFFVRSFSWEKIK